LQPTPESQRVARRRLRDGVVTLLGCIAMLLEVPCSRAADPQPYRVELASTGNRQLDTTLRQSSQLIALRSSAAVSPFGLIGRARGDVARLTTVLESFGYYQGSISIRIEDMALEQSSLPERLTALPRGTDARVAIAVTLGPLYRIGRIDIDGTLPPEARSALGLQTGAPAVAADVLQGGARLQAALQNMGYAYARVDAPIAYENPDTDVLDLSFHVDAGPRVRFGEVRFTGLKQVREAVVRRRVQLPVGELYNAALVERARRELLDLGVFGAVSIQLAKTPDSEGRVPITFRVRERLRRVVGVNAAYSTDLGGSGGVTWSNRNLTGRADQLSLSATIINLGGGSATTSTGYDFSAKYVVPDVGRPDQSLTVSLGALKQSLQAYDQTAQTAGVSMRRRLSSVWSVGLGVSAEKSFVIQPVEEGVEHSYSLFSLTASAFYDSTNLPTPLDDPLHGIRGTFSVAPTLSVGNPQATFIITQWTIATYFDLTALAGSTPGWSVLALRFVGGIASGASALDLPPDQRFYAGGSGTIRGFRYQSVGPTFSDGTPTGGTALAAVGAELRQRFTPTIGGVLFVDGGEVSDNAATPTAGEFRVGVGTGIRYYTPIGPIRFDVAFPVRRQPADDRFEIYIGLGQAF
jgi:translocation and assembly module TamA